MELLQMSWRSISMAVVPSTELPSCVTGSPAILRGGFNLCMQIILSDALEYNYNACWHLFILFYFFNCWRAVAVAAVYV